MNVDLKDSRLYYFVKDNKKKVMPYLELLVFTMYFLYEFVALYVKPVLLQKFKLITAPKLKLLSNKTITVC